VRRTRSTPAAGLLALLVTTLLQPLAHAAEPAAAPALEAWAIKSVPLPAHDSAYDKLRNKVLVTVRSSHPSLGNMLVEIDPDTGTLGRRVFVGSEPKQLAVTDDGAFAYVGLGGANRVVKVDLSTFAVALSFATGPDTGVNGPLFPEEIEPLPGRNDAVAVVLSDRIFGHEGIWIFVDGVQLPSHTDDQTDTDRMEFVSPSEIMGFRDHNGYYSMLRYAVDASGIRRTGYRLPAGAHTQKGRRLSLHGGQAVLLLGLGGGCRHRAHGPGASRRQRQAGGGPSGEVPGLIPVG
jgi:hypothetical protein